LITREQIVLQMPTNAKEISMKFSTVLLLISIGCLCLILLFIFIMILIHILSSRKRTEKKSHFSPTTPDRYLIDNEYVSSCVWITPVCSYEFVLFCRLRIQRHYLVYNNRFFLKHRSIQPRKCLLKTKICQSTKLTNI